MSYRLNYVTEVEVDPATDAGFQAESAEADTLREADVKPRADQPDAATSSVYTYRYGANYSTGIVPLGCFATFYIGGGLCWLYFGAPFAEDTRQIREAAEHNLAILLNGRRHRLLGTEYERVDRLREEPYYVLSDSDGQDIAEGAAPATQSMFAAQPEADPEASWPQERSIFVPFNSYTFRAARLSRYLSSMVSATTTVVDAYDEKQAVQPWDATYNQTTFEIFGLKPEGFSYGFMPSYAYRRLHVTEWVHGAKATMFVPGTANAYSVVSQATSLLVGVTYNSTGGITPSTRANAAAFDAGLWLGAVEYLSNEVQYQARRAKKNYWDFGNEVRLDVNFYYVVAKIRSALGVHLQKSWISELKLPPLIEFRGTAYYREDRHVYEQPRLSVDKVAVSALSWGMSYSFLFDPPE